MKPNSQQRPFGGLICAEGGIKLSEVKAEKSPKMASVFFFFWKDKTYMASVYTLEFSAS